MSRRSIAAMVPQSARAAVCLSLLTLIALASGPTVTKAQTTAQTAGVLPREKLQALLDESSKALKNLISARDQTPPPTLAVKKDKRGKTMADDLKQTFMPPELQKKLQALEASATTDLAAGDLPGVQVQLAQMRRGLSTEIALYQAIEGYWQQAASQNSSGDAARRSTLKANGIRIPNQEQIDKLTRQLDQQVAAGDFLTAMHATWPKLNEQQLLARQAEYQQLLAKIDSESLRGLRWKRPSRTCSPANGSTSKAETPNVRPDFPSINDYFPKTMKQRGLSGSPEVFVVVDAKGCPERAVLVGPSEHEEFDQAGLQLAADGRYFPAEKEGKPVRAGFYIRLNFDNPS